MDSTVQSSDPRAPTAREQEFWLGQIYTALVGVVGFGAILLANAHYLANGSNRFFIELTIVGLFLFCGICFVLRHRMVASRYCVSFFAGGNMLCSLTLGTLYALSARNNLLIGIGFFLPLLHIGIGFPRRAAIPSGLVCLAVFGSLFLLPISNHQQWEMLIMLFLLIDGYALVVFGSAVRDRKDDDLKRLNIYLERMAMTDALTGCLNQRGFNTALTRELARCDRSGRCLSLLLIDVDDFKLINDQYGHAAGDNTLADIGNALLETTRDGDYAGRPGGDELALLASDTDSTAAQQLAERLQAALGERERAVPVTLSIGIYTAEPHTAQLDTMFNRADQALYRAKRTGRGRICVFDAYAPPTPETYGVVHAGPSSSEPTERLTCE